MRSMNGREMISQLKKDLDALTSASRELKSTIQSLEALERARETKLATDLANLARRKQLRYKLRNGLIAPRPYISLQELDVINRAVENAIEDRDGVPINIGDTVEFLTPGKHSSTSGTVIHFSRDRKRVFAIDTCLNNVSRVPRNVSVVIPQTEISP